jgi:NADPH-dependent 2,4-dienoyl-CoA reductase/sulfur reductase-like enzyme
VNLTQGSDQGVPSQPDIISRAIAEKGKHAINEFIGYHTDPTTPGPTIPIPPTLPPRYPAPPQTSTLPVCILGAGAAGLYIAMMLDSLGINYDLMEGSGRTGGRIFTYHFPKNPDKFQYFVSLPPVIDPFHDL